MEKGESLFSKIACGAGPLQDCGKAAGARYGVLGGSFDPVHLGHIHLAREVQKLFELGHIHLVVASDPPHKAPENLIPLTHRYAMVTLAAAGCPDLIPSLVELEPPASSFSIDTLAKLAECHGGIRRNLYFIAGGDALLDIAGWHGSETLLSTYNFVFVTRPGFAAPDATAVLPRPVWPQVVDCRGVESAQIKAKIADEMSASQNRIFIVDISAPDISASRIRELVSMGQPVHNLLPMPVYEYIRKLHLYGGR